MKSLLLLLSVAMFSVSSHAQSFDKADAKFEPVWRAHCEKRDYPLVNGVDQIKKISESSNEVTFSFRSYVASCKDKVFTIFSVNPQLVYVGISKTGLFGGSGVDVNYDSTSTATYVTVTFDKNKAFKKERTERKYMMGYYPWGAFQRYFPWTVILSKDATESATLRIN